MMQNSFFRKIENLLMTPFAALFNFIARKVSYTFSVAFTTSLGGFLIAAYIALFLAATLRFDASGTGDNFVILFTVMTLFLYAPAYYLHFGMLYNVGVPCFTKKLNYINEHVRDNTLIDNIDSESAVKLLNALEALPGHNMKAALIYPTVVMVAVVLQELLIGMTYNALLLLLGISSAIFIYVFFTYISAELLTGSKRRAIKEYLVSRNIRFNEKFSFSIRQKFIFINILVFIAMLELGLMFFFNRSDVFTFIPLSFIVLTVMLVGLLLFFYLVSIEQSLLEIEGAAIDLARGGRGGLYLAGLDRELIRAGQGFISAAYEVNEIRSNLEKKVEERTTELNEALESLRERDSLLQHELQIASSIQKGILPQTPAMVNGLRITAFNQSMQQVGGDMYDILPMESNCVGILMADVSGHGIPAALVTTMAKISFIEASRKHLSPRKIFLDVNDSVSRIIKTQEYLTAFFMVITPTYDVIYGNAAHRRALVLRKNSTGEVETWDSGGLFIGALDNSEVGDSYEEKFQLLEIGDRVMLYTDGLVESRNWNNQEFGEEAVAEILLQTRELQLEQVKGKIIERWKRFMGGNPVKDDISFLLIEVDPVYYDAMKMRDIGEELISVEDYDGAMQSLQKADGRFDHDAKTKLLLGKASLYKQDYSQAVTYLRQYNDLSPGDAYGFYLLSAAYYRLKDYDRAIKTSTAACQLRPGYIQAMAIVARSYEKTGNMDKALREWNRILSIDEKNNLALKRKQRIENENKG